LLKWHKKRTKLVLLFDLDGTLINSIPDLANSVNFMLKKLNKKTYDIDTISKWVGNGATVLVKRALSGSVEIKNIDEKEFKKAYEIFMNHYSKNVCINTHLYPQVKETLKKLPHKKAIITNKPYKFIKPILQKLDIDMFDLILGADSLDEKKPSPKPLLYAMEKLNEKEAIMIGDSKNDILAAKNAGIKSIALTYGYNHGEDILKYNPDFVFDKFSDILKVIHG
jgi:phosphoglycolate phosphatase